MLATLLMPVGLPGSSTAGERKTEVAAEGRDCTAEERKDERLLHGSKLTPEGRRMGEGVNAFLFLFHVNQT